MPAYLQPIPPAARADVARLAAAILDRAASLGDGRWGATPFADGFRLNVGWTEILSALPDHIRLVVDGPLSRSVALPHSVSLTPGDDLRGFYPSVPGSVLAEIPYTPAAAERVEASKRVIISRSLPSGRPYSVASSRCRGSTRMRSPLLMRDLH